MARLLEVAEHVVVVRPHRSNQVPADLAQRRDDSVVRGVVGHAPVGAAQELPVLRREMAGRIGGPTAGEPVEHDVEGVGRLRIAAESGAGERAHARGAAAGHDLAVANTGAIGSGGVEDPHRARGELRYQALVTVHVGKELLDGPAPLAGEIREELDEELIHHAGRLGVLPPEQPGQTERHANRQPSGSQRVDRGERQQLEDLAPEE